MARREIIGNCELWLGDCRDVMPKLPLVDAVIGDPPYEKEAHRSKRRTMESIKTGINVDLDFDSINEELRSFAATEATRLSQGWSMYFCQAEAVGSWRDAFEASGAKYKRTMIWVKPDSSPQFNGQMPAMGYESIPLAWCGQGIPKWNGGGKRGVFTHLTNGQDREGTHQTEKPISLMKELVTLFTNIGDTVLDPFLGSGTTLVACAALGRNGIGIEKDEKYFDLACRRIEKAYKQPDLFIEPYTKAKQGALL